MRATEPASRRLPLEVRSEPPGAIPALQPMPVSAPRVRVLTLQGALSALPALADAAVETIPRTMDVVRGIGMAHDIDSRLALATSAATNIDVVLIALTDELARLADSALSLGIETLCEIGVPVVLLLGFGNETSADFARAAEWVRTGARAALSLDATSTEIRSAILAVNAGLVVLEPRVANAMVQGLASSRRRSTQGPALAHAPGTSLPLSAREREVLALLAEGHATKQIAGMLGISAHTVKAHVESIFEKFGATTRAEAVAIGVRRGAVML